MSVSWTPAGLRHKDSGPRIRYKIRDISYACGTCSGTGWAGEKVRTWECCPGFPDGIGDWYSCPHEEAQESGPIAYLFELENGDTIVACTHCGPKHFSGRAVRREKVEVQMRGREFCPDCSRYAHPSGKIPQFELVLIQGADHVVLAQAKTKLALQMACLGFHIEAEEAQAR